MKTTIKIAAFLFLSATAIKGKAQQTLTLCAGSSTVVTAISNATVPAPSYTLNPGGITSPYPNFTVSPTGTTVYTLSAGSTYSNWGGVVITNTVTVQVLNLPVPVASISPVSQTVGCGPGVVANATCVAFTPSANVTHYWYGQGVSPVTPVSSQVSTYQMTGFGISPAIYTCVVVDNLTGCIATKTTQIISSGGTYPSFDLASVTNFSLGCNTSALSNIVINNAQVPPNGGAVSYTVLSPAFTGTNYGFGSNITYSLNTPGIYTVVVKSNNNACETRVSVNITQNITAPSLGSLSITQSTLSCANPTTLVQASSSPLLQYVWLPSATQGNSITIAANPATPTQSLLTTLTLVATSLSNACVSTTTIPVYQNIYAPNAAIFIPAGNCQNTINLTNVSVTGILPSTFPILLPIVAQLWEGPAPQITASLSSTYLAQTPGVYTLTAMDMNNGCTATKTVNVALAPTAAFAHTITGGQAVFNNASTGTNMSTTYFWDFADGNASTLQNPVHNYISAGAYLVKLIVTNPGLCVDSVIQSVNISGLACLANANFSMVPTATAQVWNAMPVNPWNVTAASWNWGDGSTSNALYSSHQYASAGMYNICLSVTVSCVASASSCTSYSVYRVSQEAMMIAVNVVAPALVTGLAPVEAGAQLSWNILPNPNQGEFKLSLDNAKTELMRLSVSDLTGRIVHEQVIEPGLASVSVHTGLLPEGIYLVTLEGKDLRATRRMIVNH